MLIIGMPGGHYHVHVLGLREIELQVLLAILLDYSEPVMVLWRVGVEEVVVNVEEVVHELPVQLVVIATYPLATLKTLITVSPLRGETVHCHFVDSIQIDWLAVNPY